MSPFNWWGGELPDPPPHWAPLWSLKREWAEEPLPEHLSLAMIVECVGGGPADGEFHTVAGDWALLTPRGSLDACAYAVDRAAGVARFVPLEDDA